MLRYQENNELHRDFHGTTNTTLDHIADHYGVEVLGEGHCIQTFRRKQQ
jgi:hypothetical protein